MLQSIALSKLLKVAAKGRICLVAETRDWDSPGICYSFHHGVEIVALGKALFICVAGFPLELSNVFPLAEMLVLGD